MLRVEWLIDAMAAARPDHAALLFHERRWTYAHLRAEMDRRAAALVVAGLVVGDVVACAEIVTDEVILAFLACCRAGGIFFHLSPHLTAAETAPLVARAGARFVLTARGAPLPAAPGVPALPRALPGTPDAAAMEEAARRAATGTAEAIASIAATSGTTGGTPKLALQPHAMHTRLPETPMWWETPDAVVLLPRPYALAVRLLCAIFAQGATAIPSVATDPAHLEAEMAAHGATALWTVPALVQLLLTRTAPPPAHLHLRVIRTSTAPLAPAVIAATATRYGAAVAQEYGSSEGGSLLGTPRDAPVGSIGTPYADVAARLVDDAGRDVPDGDVGELIVRTPALMRGYLGDPEATARALRDGWLHTGDLARRDAGGCYYLEGRQSLRINVGGFKVAPEEIEAVLEQHPGVREAAALAYPDARRGAVVRAVIVPEGEPPSVAALHHFCRERLAPYKIPRRWEFRAALLPRSSLGKVLRQDL